MNVKDNRKQDKRPFREIEPGTLFKYGDLYFIKTDRYLYQECGNAVAVRCCIDMPLEYEYDPYYEPVNAVSVLNAAPYCIPPNNLVEVFPKAVICLDEEKTKQ